MKTYVNLGPHSNVQRKNDFFRNVFCGKVLQSVLIEIFSCIIAPAEDKYAFLL
jgi:hypothetical protein